MRPRPAPSAAPLLAPLLALGLLLGCGEGAPDPAPVEQETGWEVPATPAQGADFETIFSLADVKLLELRFTVEQWNGLLHDFDANPRNEVYRQADFTWGDGAGAVILPAAAVRLRGNFSRVRPEVGTGVHDPGNPLRRAHFKVKLNEKFDGDEGVYGPPSTDVPGVPANDGRGLLGVRTLNLKHNRNDATFLREVASYELFRRAGVEAPRAAFARLRIRIGDEPLRDFGVYELIEDVDKDWVKRRFGANGFLWKSLWQQFGPADLSQGDADGSSGTGRVGIEHTDPVDAAEAAGWNSWSSPYRPSFDLKTREDEFATAEQDLNALVALLAGAPTQEQLEAAIDVQALLRAMAVNALVGMSDDYWRNGNNYYLLRRPDDGRWLFIPYDYDLSLGLPCIGADPATSPFVAWGDSRNGEVNPVLIERVLDVPVFERDFRRYVAAYASPADGVFHPDRSGPLLEALQAAIVPWAGASDAEVEAAFTTDLSALDAFLAARTATALAETAVAP